MKGWICFPIWGLEMAENGIGLEQPLFGDATIVSRSFVRKYGDPENPRAAGLLSGGGFRAVLETSLDERVGGAPLKHLVEVPPDAFIAVRRSSADDAERYAESIRALLSGTAVLTSGQAKGFAMTPLPLQWSAIPSRVGLDQNGQLSIDYKVAASNYIHLEPVRVSHKQIRESWESGSAIQGAWRIHKDDALSKALTGDWGSLSPLRRRVRSAASTLARAMESSDASMSMLFGVVAIEQLLKGASDFKEMEEMAACIFTEPNGRPQIERLFEGRHKIAHEAKHPEGQAQDSSEMATAWGLMLFAAKASNQLSKVDELLEHLRGRVLANRLAQQLRDKGKAELADELQKAVTFFAKVERR